MHHAATARVALVLLAGAGSTRLAAQDSTSADARARAAALFLLRSGRIIRVRLAAGGRMEGRFAGVDSVTLVLRGPLEETRDIPISIIDTLWVREQPTAHDAVLGLVIGGLAGGVAGSIFSPHLCACSHPEDLKYFLGGMVIGLPLGGAVGGLIGSAARGWRRWFP